MKFSELPKEIISNLDKFKINEKLYRIPRRKGNKYDIYKLIEACRNCKQPFLGRVDSLLFFCSYKCAKSAEFHPCTGKKRPDNIARLKDNHPMKNPEIARKVSEALRGIKRPYCAGDNNPMRRPEVREKVSLSQKGKKRPYNSGEQSHLWKGGVKARDIPLFDTYANQLNPIEETRRDPENYDILQVKCKNSGCRRWFTPKLNSVWNKIKAIKGKGTGEHNFYCSDGCKKNCSIFHQHKYPKDNKPYVTRNDQSALRKLVLERDGHRCQICGIHDIELVCHHINPVVQNPIESADMDNCITLCIICDKKVHKLPGCNYHELRNCHE